jgi:hypothetical protein
MRIARKKRKRLERREKRKANQDEIPTKKFRKLWSRSRKKQALVAI